MNVAQYLGLAHIDHIDAREWVNGLWFAFSLCVVMVFAGYLISSFRDNKYNFSRWYAEVGNKAAIALFFYFVGETLMRGWIYILLVHQNNGWDATWVQQDFSIAFVAAFISTIAALCCIWVFSRSQWAWLGSAAFITVFVFLQTFVF